MANSLRTCRDLFPALKPLEVRAPQACLDGLAQEPLPRPFTGSHPVEANRRLDFFKPPGEGFHGIKIALGVPPRQCAILR